MWQKGQDWRRMRQVREEWSEVALRKESADREIHLGSTVLSLQFQADWRPQLKPCWGYGFAIDTVMFYF
jgi:hypothetical protein